MAIGSLLAACNKSGEQSQPAKRFSGTIDERYYIHPRTAGSGRIVVKGCCSFAAGGAEVEQLPGDVDGRLVRGQGYQLEIAFGNRPAPLAPGFHMVERRTVDGVDLTEFRAGLSQFALEATVPLSDEAVKQGVDFPRLRAVGRCETSQGCEALQQAMASVRF